MSAVTNHITILFIILISISWFPTSSYACPKISNSSAGHQMTTLANEIHYHNRLYYEKAQPVITDAEYDKLFATLIQLEGCFPELASKDSPTKTVGSSADAGVKTVMHEHPMLSLASSTSPDAVHALLKRVGVTDNSLLLVQPKVDGLPVELVYESRRLVSAATRGNGRFGEDVTARIREISGIPLLLSSAYPDRVVVRGEVYADLPLMHSYERNMTVKYATSRHMAAGILKAQKPDSAAVAVLRLFPFELVIAGSTGDKLHSDLAALELLSGWGFTVDLGHTKAVRTFSEIEAVYRTYLANRDRQPFAMDGIVVKVDDLALRQLLGEGSRAPLWAVAWKFPPDMARTTVQDIHWQVGRSGRRTPVAEVVPVTLSGILVSRVSLQNIKEVARLGIKIGDQVDVALVGDVIPQIVNVVKSAVSNAVAKEPLVENGDSCFRDNHGCRARFLSRAVYFTSKFGLDIPGLGRERLKTLIEVGLIDDLPSIMKLPSAKKAVASALGPKITPKVLDAISSRLHPPPFRAVAALGIPGVGPVAIRRLSAQFHDLDALLAAYEASLNTYPESFKSAQSVRQFFSTPDGKVLFREFRKLGIW